MTIIATPEADLTVIKSQTPCVYVPRRFRVAGLPGIRRGAAIVGTPQGEGTIAIDVEATGYVEPTQEVWDCWIAEAARRHVATEEDLPTGDEMRTAFVSEHDLVKVGHYEDGRVIPTGGVGEARLTVWIESGRDAHLAGLAAE